MRPPLTSFEDFSATSATPSGQDARVATASLEIPAARIARFLAVLAATLLLLHLLAVASMFGDWQVGSRTSQKLYLDAENNLPTAISAGLLLMASLLLAAVARIERHRGGAFRRHWLILSLVFLGLMLDEVASLHELFSDRLRDALGLGGWLFFSWVLVGGAFVLVFGLSYLRFLAHLPASTRGRFLLAGALFVSGALLIEMLGARAFVAGGDQAASYVAIATLEEMLEISGVCVFIVALLRHLAAMGGGLRLDFK